MLNKNLDAKKYYLKGVVDRFEGKVAVIKTDDSQEVKWPINNLPEDAEEGTSVRLVITTSKSDEEEREKIAKTMLNEILKPKQSNAKE